MRFLVNENVPFASVRLLRAHGHDVAAVAEDTPGAGDREVLTRAARERRSVLTFDRDYRELVFRRRLPVPAGLVYFRFDPQTPQEPAEVLLAVLIVGGLRLGGMFTVVERGQVRQRPVPGPSA